MNGYEIINQLEKAGYKLELRPGPKIELLLKQNYKQDAIKIFHKALELNPNNTDIRAILNHID